MIRAFIAIKISPDEEFTRAFQVLKNQLITEKINWVDIENLHLTLKFLGNVTHDSISDMIFELKKIQCISTFYFQIAGVHLFKNTHTPRIIYSEIKTGPELYNLAKEVDYCLNTLNLFSMGKKFLPHLTLGRIKSLKGKDNLELVLHDLRKLYCQQIECSEFFLFESILTPSGPIYKPIESFKLL
jgi:RNA 2',3'-cyclic 3'-phosphodiesterase